MYFLDEFPELVTLGNFPGVGNPLKQFRAALQRQTQVAYVITGSAVSATEHIVRDHDSPLFLQFRALELLRKLAGRIVPGACLGQVMPIAVPAFARIEPCRSSDGQMEIDALAENGGRWAVEVKWQQKRVGRRELEQLLMAATTLQARPWYISQAGFTPEALVFATEKSILISNGEDLAALAKLAG